MIDRLKEQTASESEADGEKDQGKDQGRFTCPEHLQIEEIESRCRELTDPVIISKREKICSLLKIITNKYCPYKAGDHLVRTSVLEVEGKQVELNEHLIITEVRPRDDRYKEKHDWDIFGHLYRFIHDEGCQNFHLYSKGETNWVKKEG